MFAQGSSISFCGMFDMVRRLFEALPTRQQSSFETSALGCLDRVNTGVNR